MTSIEDPTQHAYDDWETNPDPPHQPFYLEAMLRRLRADGSIRTILDMGCGNGNFAASLADAGYQMFGVDMSRKGVELAEARGKGQFARASVYDDLRSVFPQQASFDAIVCIEVIEHLYSPRVAMKRAFEALAPGGTLLITTPYWGYLKNILLAVTNRMDALLTALWDGGHIKHWSRKTLTTLLHEQGFEVIDFYGAGRRVPYLWSGMMLVGRKPLSSA